MNHKKEEVSYIAFESEMTRLEKITKMLWLLCIALLVAILVSNFIWIIRFIK